VLKAMFILKTVARRTAAAMIVTDHLPLGNEEAWQKGNGAKSGNAGFMYRVTAGRQDQVSIDCGKARGAPKAKSYAGRVVSEHYGKDTKGRTTTVNVFKRELAPTPQQREQNAVMKLAAMIPGLTVGGMDALRAGHMVPFDTVAVEVGAGVKGEIPGYVVNKEAALKMFDKDGFAALSNSGYLRTMYGCPFLAVYSPTGVTQQPLMMPWTALGAPQPKLESFPWQV
jgi:hypothetical protein